MPTLYLFHVISNRAFEYDTYSSFICCTTDAEAASFLRPDGEINLLRADTCDYHDWTYPANVTVKCIGIATPEMPIGVVLDSFHAG